MMFRIIVVRIRNIPKTTATTRTVLIDPMPGSVIFEVRGLSHSAGVTFSKPKHEPNRKPNIVENTPAQEIIPNSGIFLILYRIPPRIRRQRPWPQSPNIAPKMNE